MRFTPQDEEFRAQVRAWLAANLTGDFAALRGAGGPGREHERHAERLAWNRHLAAAGWTCLGWPAEFGVSLVLAAGAARAAQRGEIAGQVRRQPRAHLRAELLVLRREPHPGLPWV